jgi:hypothetical protein
MRMAKLWVLTLGIGSLLVLSAPAAHANCPLLDPDCLTDVVDEVADGAGDVADDTVDGVTDVVDDTVDVVDETVNGGPGIVEDGTGVIENTVDQGEETVKDVVDDVVGADETPVPVPDPDNGTEPGRDQTPGGAGGGAFPRGLEPPAPPSPVLQIPVPISTTGVSARGAAAPSDGPGLLDRLGGAAAAAARQLSFPIALSLVVVAFVLFQNYLDRKDPKLAVAPIAADVMKFE